MIYNHSRKQGFTLVEMLVVIAIIGVLSAVVLASIGQARANARDKSRVADLEQALAALHIYGVSHGTYEVPGSEEGSFSATAAALVSAGLMTTAVADPLSGNDGHSDYLLYFFEGGPTRGVCLFAQLERASSTSGIDRALSLTDGAGSGSGANYAVCSN